MVEGSEPSPPPVISYVFFARSLFVYISMWAADDKGAETKWYDRMKRTCSWADCSRTQGCIASPHTTQASKRNLCNFSFPLPWSAAFYRMTGARSRPILQLYCTSSAAFESSRWHMLIVEMQTMQMRGKMNIFIKFYFTILWAETDAPNGSHRTKAVSVRCEDASTMNWCMSFHPQSFFLLLLCFDVVSFKSLAELFINFSVVWTCICDLLASHVLSVRHPPTSCRHRYAAVLPLLAPHGRSVSECQT